jgi:hypothetical protein
MQFVQKELQDPYHLIHLSAFQKVGNTHSD